MSLSNSEQLIEALIFASDKSISVEEIHQVLTELAEEEISAEDIAVCIEQIDQKYRDLNLAIELVHLNGGYQFLTRKEYYPVINQLQIQRSKKKLSQAALETLSIIAYKQPLTKLEIEQIRGVNCDYTVQKLLEKELISIVGKAETLGKPLLYATSGLFMDYFGINSTKELPKLEDLISDGNEIGERTE
ncbi:MAG: SMC-Scp complex subunit ScpB [Bacteroidetes bacterium]|nr:SMC-Scp complex subunit ScpB [Bacteroidota bacterium]